MFRLSWTQKSALDSSFFLYTKYSAWNINLCLMCIFSDKKCQKFLKLHLLLLLLWKIQNLWICKYCSFQKLDIWTQWCLLLHWNDYFHYQLNNHLVSKMSENGDKCPSQFVQITGFVQPIFKETQRYSVYHIGQRKLANPPIWEAETSKCIS